MPSSMLALAIGSVLSRRLSLALTVLTMALSVALFLSVERLRIAARDSFDGTISGVDVLVGARGGNWVSCSIPCSRSVTRRRRCAGAASRTSPKTTALNGACRSASATATAVTASWLHRASSTMSGPGGTDRCASPIIRRADR